MKFESEKCIIHCDDSGEFATIEVKCKFNASNYCDVTGLLDYIHEEFMIAGLPIFRSLEVHPIIYRTIQDGLSDYFNVPVPHPTFALLGGGEVKVIESIMGIPMNVFLTDSRY